MNSQEIRQSFLGFFESRGHRILPSSSVIPHGDKTLLFTNAGMNQFKDIFTGRSRAESPRATTVQKCIRAGGKHNDLDNVGYTARHLTFFEMLGNFSFGDYFKEEAIQFGWEYLTDTLGLDAQRLWATVYLDDDEAHGIWSSKIGVPESRIVRLGEKDNYWSMGDVGPCGPCSEILLDRGEQYACGPDCGIGRCECDRYFEIWNLVFMQFDQDGSGAKVPLERPSIDTGMGVERLAMVLQGVESVFETDVLRAAIDRIEELTGVAYSTGEEGISHRVIADHVRCLVFAFADGAEPSNEGRGYVLRRILRRAARYGRKLELRDSPLLVEVVPTFIEHMEKAYPEIRSRQQYIEGVIRSEEERFGRTLDQGIARFEDVVERIRGEGVSVIPGQDSFLLYDTFGFPFDLVEQMAAERGLSVDADGFEKAMLAQRERSRSGSSFAVHASTDSGEAIDVDRFPETSFVGYEHASCASELLAAPSAGEDWQLVLSDSPFYAESGGQVGDTGRVRGDDFVFEVVDTRKQRGRWVHLARLVDGDPEKVSAGAEISAEIDRERRARIERNHTATHLLHAALRQVLGDHVHQKGSLVDPSRLRFDVTHFNAIAPEERLAAEDLVLEAIARNDEIETFETDYDDAIRRGAMALFGEKYGDVVRVVKIGDFSTELCGGTHVRRSGDIGPFLVAAEGSVSAGVRRLEALTASGAVSVHRRNAQLVERLSARLRTPVDQIDERVSSLQDEIKKLRSSQGQKRTKAAPAGDLVKRSEVEGTTLVTALVEDAGMNALLELYDGLKPKEPSAAFALVARQDGKVQLVVGLSPALVKAGWDARALFDAGKDAIGGRGGGRPDLVRGGGTDPAGAEKALAAIGKAFEARARS